MNRRLIILWIRWSLTTILAQTVVIHVQYILRNRWSRWAEAQQTCAKESLIAWSMSKFASSRINIVGKYMHWSMVAISAPVCKCTSIYNLSSANTRAALRGLCEFRLFVLLAIETKSNAGTRCCRFGRSWSNDATPIRRRIYITFEDDSVVTFHQLRWIDAHEATAVKLKFPSVEKLTPMLESDICEWYESVRAVTRWLVV